MGRHGPPTNIEPVRARIPQHRHFTREPSSLVASLRHAQGVRGAGTRPGVRPELATLNASTHKPGCNIALSGPTARQPARPPDNPPDHQPDTRPTAPPPDVFRSVWGRRTIHFTMRHNARAAGFRGATVGRDRPAGVADERRTVPIRSTDPAWNKTKIKLDLSILVGAVPMNPVVVQSARTRRDAEVERTTRRAPLALAVARRKGRAARPPRRRSTPDKRWTGHWGRLATNSSGSPGKTASADIPAASRKGWSGHADF